MSFSASRQRLRFGESILIMRKRGRTPGSR
jgi:hypothetical protein